MLRRTKHQTRITTHETRNMKHETRNMKQTRTSTLLLLAFALLIGVTHAEAPQWPDSNPDAKAPAAAPETGPGSTDYPHAKVEVLEEGTGADRFWVYTPAEPRPENAPVVVFLHGFGQLTPGNYLGWIHHVTRRGHIVVYPQYQEHALEPTANYAPNSARAVLAAMELLEGRSDAVKPIREKFALTGHSAGGITAANMAADWEELGLPKPRVVMPVQPGRAFNSNPRAQANGLIPVSDYSLIPEDCLLLPIYSDSDLTVGAWTARKIFMEATGVRPENKNLVRFNSCDYGAQPEVAHHQTPASRLDEGIDQWDWYGYWKLFDGLCDAAFRGENRKYALGNTPEQRFMGLYSDGRPFAELTVWLGDAEVDPDEDYVSIFDRRGRRLVERAPAGSGEDG
jgi:acetyl esterase/lipase